MWRRILEVIAIVIVIIGGMIPILRFFIIPPITKEVMKEISPLIKNSQEESKRLNIIELEVKNNKEQIKFILEYIMRRNIVGILKNMEELLKNYTIEMWVESLETLHGKTVM